MCAGGAGLWLGTGLSERKLLNFLNEEMHDCCRLEYCHPVWYPVLKQGHYNGGDWLGLGSCMMGRRRPLRPQGESTLCGHLGDPF